ACKTASATRSFISDNCLSRRLFLAGSLTGILSASISKTKTLRKEAPLHVCVDGATQKMKKSIWIVGLLGWVMVLFSGMWQQSAQAAGEGFAVKAELPEISGIQVRAT
ncbi:cell surface protein, partial [Lacticaseibacillus rhamnosus MTCC 5462]